jgi:hypothetical protein
LLDLIPSYHAFEGYQYPISCYFSVEGRLFLKKDEKTVGILIEEGDSNGERGRIVVFGMEKQQIPHRNPKESPTLSL